MPRIRLSMAATAALLGLAAVTTTAMADTLTTFDFSGTLSSSPNANPATVTGTFTLDQTTGTLAGVDLTTPVGAFTGSTSDHINSTSIQTVSSGNAFQLDSFIGGGIVSLSLTFAGTVDGFTGGSALTLAILLRPLPPPVMINPSGLDCDSTFPGCNGAAVVFNLTGTATPAVAATPLPAALPMFAGGLGALGLFGWRRKRKAHGLQLSYSLKGGTFAPEYCQQDGDPTEVTVQ